MIKHDPESVRRALVVMLHQCADYLSKLPESEVDALLAGELEMRISISGKRAKLKTKKSVISLDATQVADIASRLRAMDNRAEGERLLREVAPTRAALEMLARHLDAAVRREDRQEDLLRRVIEATIGFRLASAAIQGRSPARDRDDAPDLYSAQTKK